MDDACRLVKFTMQVPLTEVRQNSDSEKCGKKQRSVKLALTVSMPEGNVSRGERMGLAMLSLSASGAGLGANLLFGSKCPDQAQKEKTPTGGKGLFFSILVGVRGFEPPASASRRQHSTRLSYTPNARNDTQSYSTSKG